jgi:hypothetical protein
MRGHPFNMIDDAEYVCGSQERATLALGDGA